MKAEGRNRDVGSLSAEQLYPHVKCVLVEYWDGDQGGSIRIPLRRLRELLAIDAAREAEEKKT